MAVSIEFGLLGPLVVRRDGQVISVPGGKPRAVLAALLLNAGQLVAAGQLAEVLWGADPPPSARVSLQNHIKRLRQALGQDGRARIVTRPGGYAIRVASGELDVARFQAALTSARAAARDRSWEKASAQASAALLLWRGEPLADVGSELLAQRVLPHLTEICLQAWETRLEAEIELGRHAETIVELRRLVAEHPLREHLHALLMLALRQYGQRADALTAYQAARRILIAELGAEPGPELRREHEQILASDRDAVTAPDAPGREQGPAGSVAVVPRQLPASVAHFVGRTVELKILDGLLEQALGSRDGAGGAVVISAIGGTAGVGKTTLAVHWAHRHADRFPDGQLYVNLRGFDPSGTPLQAATIVRRFLDAFSVPSAHVPADLDAQIDLYRSLLADKRMLIILDNARDSEQARPLLPGAAGCLVLITSRNQLSDMIALNGAVPLTVDLLTRDEARELLIRRLGPQRVTSDHQAGDKLIDLCARLPLALNVAASRAVTRPDTPLGALVAELRGTCRRLDLLSAGQGAANLRAVFSWSYQTLSGPAARMFRLLGVHPGPDISVPAAASLAAVDRDRARRALGELTAAHLLTEHITGRYSLHDLLRAYATEHTSTTPDDRFQAMHRILDHYLHTARTATLLLFPARDPIALAPPLPGTVPEDVADDQHALAWFDAERPALLAITALAVEARFHSHAWQIPSALAVYLERRGHWDDYVASQTIALAAAEHAGDLAGQASARCLLGRASSRIGSHQNAHTHLRHALDLYRKLGDRVGQAHTHHSLGWIFGQQSRHREALHQAHRALALYQAAGHRTGQARALNTVGWYHSLLGMHKEALTYCQQALDRHRELGNHDGEADAWDSLGHAHHHLGHPIDATACYKQALGLFQKLGDRRQQADILGRLGDSHHAAGDHAAARHAWNQALAILNDLHHPDADAPDWPASRSAQPSERLGASSIRASTAQPAGGASGRPQLATGSVRPGQPEQGLRVAGSDLGAV